MSCRYHKGVYDLSCAKEPSVVYINALADTMPECDRAKDMTTLESLRHADVCNVYCAQKTCGAAKTFMEKHQDELRQKCSMVAYLERGALAMKADDLVDGPKCHSRIAEFNAADGVQSTCLTCAKESIEIPLVIDKQKMRGKLLTTVDEPPEWFLESGIIPPLPPPFQCDERYKHPLQYHQVDGSSEMQVDIRGTDLPPDATMAYWASQSGDRVLEASRAYGSFANSGIVKCKKGLCTFKIDRPGSYTAEGKVFTPHVHFTTWKDGHWELKARTIEFE